MSVVSQPALLAPRGVPRTLAHRPDTRAPEVFGAPRVRSASPLRGLLYAFWRHRSRLASARGGFPMGFMSGVNRERMGDHAEAAPAFRDPWPVEREDTDAIGWNGKISTR